MHQTLRTIALGSALAGALLVAATTGARADSHLPSLDLQALSIFQTSGNITNPPGIPGVNGNTALNYYLHVPLVKGVVFSYDHWTNGLIYNSFTRVAIGGKYVNPGEFRDNVDTFRLDAPFGRGFNAEIGTAYRHRVCCPAAGDRTNPTPYFYHDNYLGLSYSTPAIRALGGSTFIYGITGHASPHFSDTPATVAASIAAGIPDAKRTELGITQAATLVVPVDPRDGFSVAGTFTWGAFNYFSNLAVPIYYDITILSATKTINKMASFTASVDNYVQRPQGYPFPLGSGINGASLNLSLNMHVAP